MGKRLKEWIYAVVIAGLTGCAGEMGTPLPAVSGPSRPMGVTATPGAVATTVTGTTATVTPAPSDSPAPPVAGAPSTVNPTPMDVPRPDMMTDTPNLPIPKSKCDPRRVSNVTPCSDDPDPCGLGGTGFPGDEYCLPKPPEGQGIQIHFGPKDYKNPGNYTLAPGLDVNTSVLAKVPDIGGTKYFKRVQVHMRPGSHHWISMTGPANGQEGFYPDTGCGSGQTFGRGGFGGGQNLIYDNPPGGVPAPELEGLGQPIAPGTVCMGLHAYNLSEVTQLREIWVNLWFIDQADIKLQARPIGVIGELNVAIPPGAEWKSTFNGRMQGSGSIIQLFGHRHKWTERMAVWLRDELIYDSWDWEESATFNYDSLTTNPPINTEAKVDGAVSGEVKFSAGDPVRFTCFVKNGSETVLRFRNELVEGEMCNLWGTAIGGGLNGQF